MVSKVSLEPAGLGTSSTSFDLSVCLATTVQHNFFEDIAVHMPICPYVFASGSVISHKLHIIPYNKCTQVTTKQIHKFSEKNYIFQTFIEYIRHVTVKLEFYNFYITISQLLLGYSDIVIL